MKKSWVKICGTTNYADAELAWSLNADALGFVFVEGSSRKVTVDQVREIVDTLARPIERIGVVQSQVVEEVVELVDHAGLSGVQLHGDEPQEFVRALRGRLPAVRIIKGVHVTSAEELKDRIMQFQDCGLDNLLLDSHVAGQSGGTGIPFDWKQAAEALQQAGNKVPVIVAGGLNAANVAEVVETFHPFGVDVVSGVESEKGRKDPKKLRAFIAAVCKEQKSEVA